MSGSEKIHDVAIIGGGLAGLTLAIQCVDAGYKTILFEKENYPFHKVCGEYVSMESLPFLQKLGFPSENFDLPIINKLQLSNIEGNVYEFPLATGGFGISRYSIDYALYELAKLKGADIFTNSKVSNLSFINNAFSITTNTENYISKIAAASFGKRSNLDVKWNRDFIKKKPGKLSNYVGVKYHIQYPFPKEQIALHNFQNGYCGISNIENNKCCLCYLTTANNLKQNNNSLTQLEKNVLWKNPELKKIFTNATFLYNEPLVISQISFSKKTQVEDHVLMVGDAAGLITPLCGNGMSMAMHASKIAFENIDAFLQHKIDRVEMEKNYSQQWQKKFSKRLLVGRTVQRLFGNNASTSLFLKIMNKNKWLAKQIIRSTHGDVF
jgi:flavin-dependent dehydrogenase